ncbi:mitochondrial carrier domain-containing protein [Zopfochytrium polystomum]|nr:mitochondrial carrier domain-containing protein [Zopfochytrium polystomum]
MAPSSSPPNSLSSSSSSSSSFLPPPPPSSPSTAATAHQNPQSAITQSPPVADAAGPSVLTGSTTAAAAAGAAVSKRTKEDKRSFGYIVRSLVAGGIAGCAAKTVIAPLDRVKILFQTGNPHFEKYSGSLLGVGRASREIILSDGFRGLFQGHSATMLRIFPYAAIKFMSYEQFKAIIMPDKKHETSFRRLLAGSLAGVTCVLFTYPLDLLRTRLAFEVDPHTSTTSSASPSSTTTVRKKPSLLTTAKLIYSETNPYNLRVLNFYRGFMPTVYGIMPYAGISFLTYESLKSWAYRHPGLRGDDAAAAAAGGKKKMSLNWWAQMIIGGVSGALGQTSSYPLEVVRRNMQVAGRRRERFVSTWEMARNIFRKRGVKGFFVGLSIGYVKILPMHAASFYVYEYMKVVFQIT